MTVPEKGIIIAIALLALVASGTFFNTATIGEVEEGTKIFFKIEVKAPVDHFNPLRYKDAHLHPQAQKIGAIVIRENRHQGGIARLVKGGPNMNFAHLWVFSTPSGGIDVTIEFYNTPTTRKNCLYINFGTYIRSKSRYRG